MATITEMSQEPNPLYNISLYPILLTFGLNAIGNNDQACCAAKYTALVCAEIGSLISIPIGIIETIFWTAIFLLAKTVHVFIPRSFETATSISSWFYQRVKSAFSITTASVFYAVFNFFKSTNDIDTLNGSVIDVVEKSCAPIVDFQFFNNC